MTANDKYPFRDLENLLSPTQLQVSLKPKTLSDFSNPFLEATSNFKHFEKKIILIATSLRKLQAVKDLLRPLSEKKNVLEHPLTVDMLKGSKLL